MMAEQGNSAPQVFRPRSNTLVRTSILCAVLFIAAGGGVTWGIWWSPYMGRQRVPINQQVPFSHKHHYAGLGIDCRYCHVTVETSSFAGLPPTETCMTCHSQVWTKAPVLEPVRQSWATGRPLHWNRVDNLPAFVFFNHGIHVQKGVGCSTCHGPVQDMPVVWKAHGMWMKWCMQCHSDPAPNLRPQADIFNMNWKPGPNQRRKGETLIKDYHINTQTLRDCSICHR
jgi:Cytochrome c7 and related cytochrome c